MVDLTIAVTPQPNINQNVPSPGGGGLMTNARTIRQNLSSLMQNQVIVYPRDVPKYYTRFIISEYARTTGLSQVNTLTNLGSIILPMPLQLVDSLNVSYDERALGTVGLVADKAAENIFRQMNQLAANRASETTRTQRAIDILTLGAEGAIDSIPGALAQQGLGAGSIGSAASALLDIAPNQFLTIVLEGPKYKMFEFQWKLSPKTPQEADDLRRVINAFKNHMSPGIRLDGALWSFPHVWRIGFLPNSKYLYKFKPAVLMSFTANYTPHGHVSFHRPDDLTTGDAGEPLGTPVCIDIAARFLELEYWLYNNFNDSNNPWDASPNNVPPGT